MDLRNAPTHDLETVAIGDARTCNLSKIADSGQCFRWRADGDEGNEGADNQFRIFAADHAALCETTGDRVQLRMAPPEQRDAQVSKQEDAHTLTVSSIQSAVQRDAESERIFWRNYFDCDFDYASAYDQIIDANPELAHVYKFGQGMQILNQPWFETCVTFIISQNNNIPRIKSIVESLCPDGAFPTPDQLLAEVGCNDHGLGYRRTYIIGFAAACADGWKPASLEHANVSLADQMAQLQTLEGIGPKVASCICLYCLGYKDTAPHDVWIKRAEAELGIRWHPTLAGLQQQLIFYWMRERPR